MNLSPLPIAALKPIAWIQSCYTQRFGIPRQAGLVPSATAQIVFENTQDNVLSLRGLDDFSHLWVIFIFHQQHYAKSKPLVSPPRLGGNKNMGVFATRSPNRPNPIGMSAVEIEKISHGHEQILIHIKGGDFLNGTPVLDIKPYIGFADSIANASSTWVSPVDERMQVKWSPQAITNFSEIIASDDQTRMTQLINETIALDPRPAHERNKDGRLNQQWHMRLMDIDISWQVINTTAEITNVKHFIQAGK